MGKLFAETPSTPRGIAAPASTAPLRDGYIDIRHGAPRRPVTDAVARFADSLAPRTRVLEIGAGHYNHGRFFESIQRLDADPTQNPDILGDAHHMPMEDASVDAVLAISVLEHVENAYAVVDEIERVLVPGGRVLAWVPFHFAVHAYPTDIIRFTDAGLRVCFERAGFVVEHVDREPYSGVFHNISNWIHFAVPRFSDQRWKRVANRVGVTSVRLLFPLDRRWKTSTMYSGTELIARKPA